MKKKIAKTIVKKAKEKAKEIMKERKAKIECKKIQDDARKNQKILKKEKEREEKEEWNKLNFRGRILKGKTETSFESISRIDTVYKKILEQNIEDDNIRNAVSDVLSSAMEKQAGFDKLMSFYKCAMMEVETKFNVLNQEFSMKHDRNPICSIQSRLKSYDSIMEKLGRKGWDISLDTIEKNMMDVAGIRVVCTFINDVYMLAQSLLAQDDITLIMKKDYIARPKENGYRSLHLILSVPIFLETEKRDMKVEVQIRTLSMDCWATMEHQLRYKKENKFTAKMSQSLYDCAVLAYNIDQKIEKLRKEVIKE